MSIARGTTPTFTLTFPQGTDLTTAENVYVTFRSPTALITKESDDLEITAAQVQVYLTQEETLAFSEGEIEIQVNWTHADGSRAATDIAKYKISGQLLEEVVT